VGEHLFYASFYSTVPAQVDRDLDLESSRHVLLETLRQKAQLQIEHDGAELLSGPPRRAEVPDHRDGLSAIVYYIWPVVRVMQHA
jgi:hypothetical protein